MRIHKSVLVLATAVGLLPMAGIPFFWQAGVVVAAEADWCAEHGVPESICTRCNPALSADFKKRNDWCAEHSLPESQCTICNPQLKAKFAAMAPKSATVGDSHDHGDGRPHDASGHDSHIDEVTLPADAVARYDVRVEQVSRRKLAGVITSPARIEFNGEEMAHVGSPIEGRAIDIKVRVGDSVKKDDVLLVVESPALGEAQSDFLQKRTTESVAKSALAVAQDAADRAKKLFESDGGIALAELQRRESDARAAQGALAMADAARRGAENKLTLLGMDPSAVETLAQSGKIEPKFAIRAPIDGVVIEREVTRGELVTPDEDSQLVLADTRIVWAVAAVPESQLHRITKGAVAEVRIGNGSVATIPGKVAFIGPQIDQATRAGQVRVEIDNKDGALRAGTFALISISINDQGEDEPIAVPESAVQMVEGKPCVFLPVAGEQNTFTSRPISLGPSVGGYYPVISGIDEADKIVVSGSFILKAQLGKSGASHGH